MRILGIDYGLKTIGLAFGESDSELAVPLEVILNQGEETISLLAERVDTEDIDIVVVGVPLATGKHHSSDQLERTREFIGKLKDVASIPVVEEDEAYTTAESIRIQHEEGSDAEEDALAAMLIIRGYFERL